MKSLLIVSKVMKLILSIILSILLITIILRWWLGVVNEILPERLKRVLHKEGMIIGRIVS
jgi:hypothetical protein